MRKTAALAVIALTLAGCAGRPAAHARATPARTAAAPSPEPVQPVIPSWCTPAFARAVNGRAAIRLRPYARDNPVIGDLYQRWVMALADDGLMGQADRWSLRALMGRGPGAALILLPQARSDIRHLTRICAGG